MKSLFLSLSAIVLGLAVTNAAQAGKPGGGSKGQGNHPSHVSSSSQSNHNSSSKSNSKSFNKSFTKDNFHCTHYSWCSKFGCYCYWCPSAYCYYYWCAPQCCYLPVSYIETYPPQVVVTTPTISQVVNVQNTGGSPGSVQSQGDPPPPPAGLGAGPLTKGTPAK